MPKLYGGYYGDSGDDSNADLRAQDIASQDKRLEPANQASFMEAVAQSLRDYNTKFQAVTATYNKVAQGSAASTVGLKRLESLTNAGLRFDYNKVREAYRLLTAQDKSLNYELSRCKRLLDEFTTAYQLIGANFKSPLADKHKKIAMQKETQLRLQDIDSQLTVCDGLVGSFGSASSALVKDIAELIANTGAMLPPEMVDKMSKEDRLKEIIVQQRGEAAKANPQKPIQIASLQPSSAPVLEGLGDSTMTGVLTGVAAFAIGAVSVGIIKHLFVDKKFQKLV